MNLLDPKAAPSKFREFALQLRAAEWMFGETIAGWWNVFRKRNAAPQDYDAYCDCRLSTHHVLRRLVEIEKVRGTEGTLKWLEDEERRAQQQARGEAA